MRKISLLIAGMGCGGCIEKVRQALASLDGVTAENIEIGTADLTYDPARVSETRIIEVLTKAGYPARANVADKPAQQR